MKATKPIPVRLPEYLIQRLDSIVDMRPGVTRAAMIRYMIETWLDYTEKNGIPSNWEEIMKRLDGRTKLSKIRSSSAEAKIPCGNQGSKPTGTVQAAGAFPVAVDGPGNAATLPSRTLSRKSNTQQQTTQDTPHSLA
jgi:predicted DNA-binding protein